MEKKRIQHNHYTHAQTHTYAHTHTHTPIHAKQNGAIPADDCGFLYLIIYYDRYRYVNVCCGMYRCVCVYVCLIQNTLQCPEIAF